MERGQAHTLEAFVASLLVLSGIVFALQTTAVTPLSASTSNQHVGNQERAAALGVMDAAEANGTLRDAVVYWNTTGRRFAGAGEDGVYTNGGPPRPFGETLNETFVSERTAFDLVVRYRTTSGSLRSAPMVDMGSPTDDATAASRRVVLYDDTRLSSNSSVTVSEAATNDTFYRDVRDEDGYLFNVVEVRIVTWRI